MSFLHHATAAQFKPVKLYVLLNDPVCVNCVQTIRTNVDLERQVEVIDVGRLQNRPTWLKGAPTLVDESGKIYLGSEAVMWIKYNASQSLAGVMESTGTASMNAGGGPAAIDGAAALTGSLGMASFVPQQVAGDQDIYQSIGGQRAEQRFDNYMIQRQHMARIAPPNTQQVPGQGYQLPPEYQPQQVGRGGGQVAEELNHMLEQHEQNRQALLTQARNPHYRRGLPGAGGGGSGKMGWNPIQTERVSRPQTSADQWQQQLQALQQQRQAIQVPVRQIQY